MTKKLQGKSIGVDDGTLQRQSEDISTKLVSLFPQTTSDSDVIIELDDLNIVGNKKLESAKEFQLSISMPVRQVFEDVIGEVMRDSNERKSICIGKNFSSEELDNTINVTQEESSMETIDIGNISGRLVNDTFTKSGSLEVVGVVGDTLKVVMWNLLVAEELPLVDLTTMRDAVKAFSWKEIKNDILTIPARFAV